MMAFKVREEGPMAESGDTVSLPNGLTIRKRGESIETVSTNAIEVRLLAASGGTEVLQGSLKQGEFITLTSTKDAVETYYVLHGSLSYTGVDETFELSSGDTFITEGLNQPVSLIAETQVEFLCLTTRPTFAEMSRDVRELMQLADDIELKDGYTAGHCRRLRTLSNAVGEALDLPPHRLHLLNYGAYLHDVGKTKVPLSILRKPGKLTPEEWEIVKQHPTFGREILEPTFMHEVGPIVEQHHERFDGSGYPFGLRGEDILVEAAIVAVADTYDTLTTDRPYHKAVSSEAAQAELKRHTGTLFSVTVVDAFLEVLPLLIAENQL